MAAKTQQQITKRKSGSTSKSSAKRGATKKQTGKRATAKNSGKPAVAKPRAKSTAKKSTAKRTPAKKQTTKRAAPKTVRRADWSVSDHDRTGAEKATALMRQNTRGDKRAPVNATQVALVRKLVGRKSTATLARDLGFKTKTQLAQHASGDLEQNPDGVSAALTEFAAKLGDVSGASKIRGRKLTAILAVL